MTTETKICSHCNQPIENEDNLILCASCKKTYHRECWGKCACFYNCQSINNRDTTIESDTISSAEHTIDETDNYIGANSKYYQEVFEEIKDGYCRFNWSAGLFSGCWLFYRKCIKNV